THERRLKQTFLTKPINGTFPCLNCAQCNSIIRGDQVMHPSTGKAITILGYHTCLSKYVVYYLKCPCGLGYVGKTIQCAKDRISKHKSDIAPDKDTPVTRHFKEKGHNASQLRFQILEENPRPRRGGNRDRILLQLQTVTPYGLNERIEYHWF
ncbi:hypothetical protein XELAEV_18009652mg, partial [Xenopus laevis]